MNATRERKLPVLAPRPLRGIGRPAKGLGPATFAFSDPEAALAQIDEAIRLARSIEGMSVEGCRCQRSSIQALTRFRHELELQFDQPARG